MGRLHKAELKWLIEFLSQKIKNKKVSVKLIRLYKTIREDEIPTILREIAVMEIIREKLWCEYYYD